MCGWLLLRNSKLRPQERTTVLSSTSGETSFRDISEKLRSQWNGEHLATCGRHGARIAHERRHGSEHRVDGSDDHDDEVRMPPNQPGESHDGAHGSDDADSATEKWDQPKKLLVQNNNSLLDDDDERMDSLVHGESDALAAASVSNRTLAQARQEVKDARLARKPVAQEVGGSAYVSHREDVYVVVHILLETAQLRTNKPERGEKAKNTSNGKGGVVFMVKA